MDLFSMMRALERQRATEGRRRSADADIGLPGWRMAPDARSESGPLWRHMSALTCCVPPGDAMCLPQDNIFPTAFHFAAPGLSPVVPIHLQYCLLCHRFPPAFQAAAWKDIGIKRPPAQTTQLP